MLEVRLNQKPFSANKMHYMTRKADTKEYKKYKSEIFQAIGGNYDIDPTDKYKLSLVVGYSSKLSDLDNAFKPLLDSMQRAMGFDDRQIFEIESLKDHTKKGEEYIMIRLEQITENQWKRRIKKLFSMFGGDS